MPRYEIDIREVRPNNGPGCGTMIFIGIFVLWLLANMK